MIGQMIREARMSQGLTQSELAIRSSVGVQAIWDLEHGSGRLPVLVRVMESVDLRLTGLPRGRSLPERIRLARIRRGWSQQELGTRAGGLSKGAIIRLEAGTARVSTLEATLRILAPNVRARKPEVVRWAHGQRDCRFTPLDLLEKLVGVFGEFALDPCSGDGACVRADRYYREEDDGLAQTWTCDGPVFVNPPYSIAAAFMRKALAEWQSGQCGPIILLLRVKTDGPLFQDHVAPNADVFFLRDRLRFLEPSDQNAGSSPVPFGNMLVVFGCQPHQVAGLVSTIPCRHLAKP